jgi:urease accessory protein
MKRPVAILATVMAAMVILMPALALAHHAIDGRTPESFGEGIFSGLAHPIIGLDHLVFILAAGLAAGALGLGIRMPALFVCASLIGLAIHLTRIDVPLVEAMVATSIVVLGLAIGSRSGFGTKVWMALFVAAGLFHGYAYGETVVEASRAPLAGYLIGLGVVQSALAGMTYLAGHKLAEGAGHAKPEMRHLGALLAVIGAVFFVAALRQGA